jgi:hypothetical protein
MRGVCLLLLAPWCALSQSERVTYTFDADGRRVPERVVTATNGTRGELLRNANGRLSPTEVTEEKVISAGASGKVVERIIKQFDPMGQLASVTKIRLEEQKHPDGSTTAVSTTYDRTLNGSFELRERTVAQSRHDNGQLRTETLAERPTVNGSIEVVERRVAVEQVAAGQSRQEILVYRREPGAGFRETEREVTVSQTTDGVTLSTTEKYNTAATGRMELANQYRRRVEKQPDGSEREVVDILGAGVGDYSPQPALRERQIIERKPAPGGMTETFSIQRPELGSGKLSKPQPISETVCRGNCR